MNNRGTKRLSLVLANLAWFLSCIPSLIAFVLATRNVKHSQSRILARILKLNATTEFGKSHQFESIRGPEDYKTIPLSEYEDYAAIMERVKDGYPNCMTSDSVEALLPTSGSTKGTKLIPFTQSLGGEFRAAVNPWIGLLYFAYPSILLGRHYWSISPTSPCQHDSGAKVPVGFPDDSAYLGPIQRYLASVLFAVPSQISLISDQQAWEYLTLLFLLREKNLRVISVWHPSFLTLMVKNISKYLPSILRDIESGTISERVIMKADLRKALNSRLAPSPSRARELQCIDFSKSDFPMRIWPSLRVISCWTEGRSELCVRDLSVLFPAANIQGKGLAATEGIVSFPIGRQGHKACAIRSHFLEFIDSESGCVENAWEIREGRTYSVVLTTGGGLYRYNLHDVVRVTGFFNQVPCLAFISRDHLVSDIVGEKLNVQHVEESMLRVERETGLHCLFAMLAPLLTDEGPGYVLYVQVPQASNVDYSKIASSLEVLLCSNFHYQHARRLYQLRALRVFRITGDAAALYRNALLRKRMRVGDIKFTALSADGGWAEIFQGDFVA